MKVPWKKTGLILGSSAVVQVSRLELKSDGDVPGFLVAALQLRSTVLKSEGAVGIALVAHPISKTFWTLSAWREEDSIRGFMGHKQHLAVMIKYRDRMADSHFHTWFEGAEIDLPPDWAEAQSWLQESKLG